MFQTFKTKFSDKTTFERLNKMRRENSCFNFYFFDDDDMDSYMYDHWRKRDIYEIYSSSTFGAARADIWRYCVIFDMGGVYIDFDSSISFRLDDIPVDAEEMISFENNEISTAIGPQYNPDPSFFARTKFVSERLSHPHHTALQWFIAARPQHPILEKTISNIEQHAGFFRGRTFHSVQLAVCNLTGPVVYTKSLWEYVSEGHEVRQFGIDLEGRATFKDVCQGDTYSVDASYYANKTNQVVLDPNRMRLNLGCGDDIRRGWINIDSTSSSPRVRVMNLDEIGTAFPAGAVDEIVAKDVLSRVGLPRALSWIEKWVSLLRTGGTITIHALCFDRLMAAYRDGAIDISAVNSFIFSGAAPDSDATAPDGATEKFKEPNRCLLSEKYYATHLRATA